MIDRSGRRLVGDEVARELGGDVAGGRRTAGEIGERRLPFGHAALVVALAEQCLVAGLVDHRVEAELAGFLRLRPAHAPAGQDLREFLHVGLRVAAVDAEGVQLQQLARQVLVQALIAGAAGARVRADRGGVVEIDQHGRVADHGAQHVVEAAGDVRADGLALEGADEHGQNRLAGDGDREMVAPEMGEALDQGSLGMNGGERALADLLKVESARLLPELFLLHGLVLDGVDEIARMIAAGAEAAEFGRQDDGARQLVRQPAAGIAGDAVEVAGSRTHSEAIERDECFGFGCHWRHRRSAIAARPSAESCGIAVLMTP